MIRQLVLAIRPGRVGEVRVTHDVPDDQSAHVEQRQEFGQDQHQQVQAVSASRRPGVHASDRVRDNVGDHLDHISHVARRAVLTDPGTVVGVSRRAIPLSTVGSTRPPETSAPVNAACTSCAGSDAIRAARDLKPAVIVLDMLLPDLDGMGVLERVRATDPGVSVLFLTARDEVEHRIAGLRAGADDYVTKPLSLEEVLARLRGLLRRSGHGDVSNDNALVVADLVMDEEGHEVFRAGTRIELTATEFEWRWSMLRPRSRRSPDAIQFG